MKALNIRKNILPQTDITDKQTEPSLPQPERRVKILMIDPRSIVPLLTGKAYVVDSDVPIDIKFEAMIWSEPTMTYWIVVSHSSFDVCPFGEEIPKVGPIQVELIETKRS